MNLGVVIVCAGSGARLKNRDKSVLKLAGRPLFLHSLKVFKSLKAVKQIVLVLQKRNFSLARKTISSSRVTLASGGLRRQDSVYKGLLALNQDIDTVLIHDGARPFVSKISIFKLIKTLRSHPAAILGVKATDTLKLIKGQTIKKTFNRNRAFKAQTPQGFRKKLIIRAYEKLKNKEVTDDAQAVELLGKPVKIVEDDSYNIKITYSQDIALAKAIYNLKR